MYLTDYMLFMCLISWFIWPTFFHNSHMYCLTTHFFKVVVLPTSSTYYSECWTAIPTLCIVPQSLQSFFDFGISWHSCLNLLYKELIGVSPSSLHNVSSCCLVTSHDQQVSIAWLRVRFASISNAAWVPLSLMPSTSQSLIKSFLKLPKLHVSLSFRNFVTYCSILSWGSCLHMPNT